MGFQEAIRRIGPTFAPDHHLVAGAPRSADLKNEYRSLTPFQDIRVRHNQAFVMDSTAKQKFDAELAQSQWKRASELRNSLEKAEPFVFQVIDMSVRGDSDIPKVFGEYVRWLLDFDKENFNPEQFSLSDDGETGVLEVEGEKLISTVQISTQLDCNPTSLRQYFLTPAESVGLKILDNSEKSPFRHHEKGQGFYYNAQFYRLGALHTLVKGLTTDKLMDHLKKWYPSKIEDFDKVYTIKSSEACASALSRQEKTKVKLNDVNTALQNAYGPKWVNYLVWWRQGDKKHPAKYIHLPQTVITDIHDDVLQVIKDRTANIIKRVEQPSVSATLSKPIESAAAKEKRLLAQLKRKAKKRVGTDIIQIHSTHELISKYGDLATTLKVFQNEEGRPISLDTIVSFLMDYRSIREHQSDMDLNELKIAYEDKIPHSSMFAFMYLDFLTRLSEKSNKEIPYAYHATDALSLAEQEELQRLSIEELAELDDNLGED